jgi:hypothetical protein
LKILQNDIKLPVKLEKEEGIKFMNHYKFLFYNIYKTGWIYAHINSAT